MFVFVLVVFIIFTLWFFQVFILLLYFGVLSVVFFFHLFLESEVAAQIEIEVQTSGNVWIETKNY